MHNYQGAPKQLDRDYVLGKLQPWLEDNDSIKIGHNLKYDRHIFATYNISLRGQIFDTMVLSYVYNSTATRHNLDAVSKRYLNISPTVTRMLLGKALNKYPLMRLKLKRQVVTLQRMQISAFSSMKNCPP